MPTYATIQVRPATKKLLEAAKEGGETFDDVIRRKLAEAERAAEEAFLKDVYERLADRAAFKPLR